MWKALTDISPFLYTKERLDDAVCPGVRVLLPWWVAQTLVRDKLFLFASVQEFSHAAWRMHLEVAFSPNLP